MTQTQALILQATGASETLPLDDWAGRCAQALDAGDRLLTLFGRVAGEQVLATALLQGPNGTLRVLRGAGQRGQSFPSLTPKFPAAQMLERELWEQTGLVPAGHPWLKPVRYQGERQQHMHEHPFFTVRGQEVHEVGVGPIHASVIEPGHFRFMCHGEKVHHLEIQLGYQHRDVEAQLLTRPALDLSPLVESIVGDSSVAYVWGYCAAVEALSGSVVSESANAQRGVALELERIAMHLATLNGLATDIAFLQGGASYGRLRTAIINASMRVCGSRFGRGWLRPGGVRCAIDEALQQDLCKTLAAFARDLAQVNTLMLESRSVQSRFQGVGVVSQQAAQDIGLNGLVARASGVAFDTRVSLAGSPYTAHPMALLTEASGDCWARMKLRMREIDESLRWLGAVLQTSPRTESVSQTLTAPLAPEHLCISVVEGFRGPVIQALETDAAGRLVHYKVQDPSLQNWFGLALAVRNNEISDFPICNKSFDLSYCGNDL
jgi:Ni,Fe-hydrogenase III large subunit